VLEVFLPASCRISVAPGEEFFRSSIVCMQQARQQIKQKWAIIYPSQDTIVPLVLVWEQVCILRQGEIWIIRSRAARSEDLWSALVVCWSHHCYRTDDVGDQANRTPKSRFRSTDMCAMVAGNMPNYRLILRAAAHSKRGRSEDPLTTDFTSTSTRSRSHRSISDIQQERDIADKACTDEEHQMRAPRHRWARFHMKEKICFILNRATQRGQSSRLPS
jgi:hypothetical protein